MTTPPLTPCCFLRLLIIQQKKLVTGIKNLGLNFWSDISRMRHSVSSPDKTRRRELKIQRNELWGDSSGDETRRLNSWYYLYYLLLEKWPLFHLISKHSLNANLFVLAWENSRHLASLPRVSPPNDVWETSAEMPYWWHVTTQIWVVFLIGNAAWEIWFNQSEALPGSG